MEPLIQRVEHLTKQIDAAARRAGRSPAEVTLIAVTKTHPVARIQQAVAAGIVHLGENRVQEAQPKIADLAEQQPPLHWHLIGHLQRNKARFAVHLFDMIHSVDSVRLAAALNRSLEKAGPDAPVHLPVLLQVNVSGEASKEGFALPNGATNQEALPSFLAAVEEIVALPRLQVCGLMTVAPFSNDPEQSRPVFRHLAHLRETLARRFSAADWSHLSMGMSNDFAVAIEEGATYIRIGRALFGERQMVPPG